MSVKLIGSARFRPFRNLWLLEELGVPYEYIPAHPRSKEAYACNPFGKVPTLQVSDFTLYESVAINTYLADKYRSDGLELVPPPGSFARGRYEQLIATIYGELDCQSLWIHRKHESEVAKYLGGENRQAVAVAQQWFDKVMDVLSAELGSGDYLMGETFTAADVLFVHCLNWAERIGWGQRWSGEDKPEMKTIASYVTRCRARPAYIRAKEIAQNDTKQLNLERL